MQLPAIPGSPSCEGCAAGVVGNKIYVVGRGEDNNDDIKLASTIIFDTSVESWESPTTGGDAGNGSNKTLTGPPPSSLVVPNMTTGR